MEANKKKEMKVTDFNDINTEISSLLDKLSVFDHIEITASKKLLKEAGKRVSNFYYNIIEKTESNE